jgi:hypothetical protein
VTGGRTGPAILAVALMASSCAQEDRDATLAPERRLSHDASCPTGYALVSSRSGRLLSLLKEEVAGRFVPSICFGPRGTEPVLAGAVILLDAEEPDEELAADLAHLLVHAQDDLGDGCARGAVAARASEVRARAAEATVRARLHVPPAAAGRAAFADGDYVARCSK